MHKIAGRAAAWLATAFLACGGSTDGRGGPDSALDSGAHDGSIDATSPCVSIHGYAVCGGPNDCFPRPDVNSHICSVCLHDPGRAGLCSNAATNFGDYCGLCGDENLCIEATVTGGGWYCLPYEIGELFAVNGSADHVRYTDFSLFTGEALPTPKNCDAPASLRYCGGFCGGCANGDWCVGRSPVHPYGLCITKQYTDCSIRNNCEPGVTGCFTFTVQSEAQMLADRNSFCLPLATCMAAAAAYPGGGRCVP